MKSLIFLPSVSAIPVWTGGDVLTPTYGTEGATAGNAVGCGPCIRSGLDYISKKWYNEYDTATNLATAEDTNKESVCCPTNGATCTVGWQTPTTTLNTGF